MKITYQILLCYFAASIISAIMISIIFALRLDAIVISAMIFLIGAFF